MDDLGNEVLQVREVGAQFQRQGDLDDDRQLKVEAAKD